MNEEWTVETALASRQRWKHRAKVAEARVEYLVEWLSQKTGEPKSEIKTKLWEALPTVGEQA